MKKITIQLEELVCSMCASKIENALKKLDGVTDVRVLYNSSKAKLSFDEEKIDTKQIEEAINAVGYDVIEIK
ncbi:MAG: heavy-metal-associated domain-containing protein [Clostridia bacterium]|nr:heavy-metal-associated domain-containing protein [Clostridia bacterium]